MLKRFPLIILTLLLTICTLLGCSPNISESKDKTKKIVFGTTIGDFGNMVKESIKPQLEKKGYQVTLREFSDYVLLNKSLAEKNIDINIFQHRPYLKYSASQQNLDLVEVFEVPTAGLGIYAGKLSDFQSTKKEITVGVPNDPTNFTRSLRLLRDIGYLQLDEDLKAPKTLLTIKNIKKFNRPVKMIQMDAAQLPRSRDDLDFAIINGNYAISSGIDLTSALFKEKGTDYINIGVVRAEDKNAQWVKDVTEAYSSKEFKKYVREKYQGYIFPSNW